MDKLLILFNFHARNDGSESSRLNEFGLGKVFGKHVARFDEFGEAWTSEGKEEANASHDGLGNRKGR